MSLSEDWGSEVFHILCTESDSVFSYYGRPIWESLYNYLYTAQYNRPTISVAVKILVYASSHSLLLKPGCYARYLLYRREALYNKKLRQNYIVVGLFVTSMSRSLFTVFRVRVKCSRLSLLCILSQVKISPLESFIRDAMSIFRRTCSCGRKCTCMSCVIAL